MRTLYTHTRTHNKMLRLFLLSTVFSLLFSFQASAQHDELLDKTWYLDYMIIETDTIENPTRFDIDYASTVYIDSNNLNEFEFGGCPGTYWGMEIELDAEDNFFLTFGVGELPMQYCSDLWPYFSNLESFSNLYYDDFFNGYVVEEEPIYYVVQQEIGMQRLILTNINAYEAHYSSAHLSTPDFDELLFTIFPNPAQDQLYIRLTELYPNTSLEVYDINGKLLNKTAISELDTHLDVSEYASGMYFIQISDQGGNTQTGKFIKQ